MAKKKKTDVFTVDNLEIHNDKNFVIVSVNPRFYNLDVVYSAIYTFLDKCYMKIDGNPNEEILVEIKPKKQADLETLGREFNNELINYAVVGIRGRRTEPMRRTIVERALRSHEPTEETPEEEKLEEWQKDPEGINIPWEEKYGKGEECE